VPAHRKAEAPVSISLFAGCILIEAAAKVYDAIVLVVECETAVNTEEP